MSPKIKIDTLIISDVHLGSIVSRADKLAKLLQTLNFKRLILLGDIFDNSNFNRLSEENWALLTLIRKLSNPKQGREIVWVRGNHDSRIADLMAYFTGAKVYDHYLWEFRNKRFFAIHGDLFDTFSVEDSLVTKLGRQVFLFLQNFDKDSRHVVRLLDNMHTFIRGLQDKVADGAIEYARNLKAQYVFCGHTHSAAQKISHDSYSPTPSPIHYYNVGCWTRSPSTFAVIDDAGNISLESVE